MRRLSDPVPRSCWPALLAGCGGGDESADPTSGKAKGTITVWAPGVEGEKLPELARDFEKENPGVKVKVTPIAIDQAHDKILTSIAGGKTPDVSWVGSTWMGEFAKTGALDEAPSSIDQSQFFQGARDAVTVDGKAYGVPWHVETRLLYYRTDIAKKAGITSPPKTWDELKEMARALQSKGGAKYGINLSTNNWQEWAPFVWQNGGEIAEGDKYTLTSPEAVEATEFYKSFYDEKLAPPATPQGFDIVPAFVRGTHPMFFSGPWHMGLIDEAGGKGFDKKWTIAKMPAAEDRDVVRRRRRAGGVQAGREPRHGVEVRRVPDHARGPGQVLRGGGRPAVQPGGVEAAGAGGRPEAEAVRRAARGRQDRARVPEVGGVRHHAQQQARRRVHVRRVGRRRRTRASRRRATRSARNEHGRPRRRRAARAAARGCGPCSSAGASPPRSWSLFAVFLLIPIVASFALSFTSFGIGNIQSWGTAEFVGLDNYSKLLHDDLFLKSVRNTAYFVVVGVPLTVVGGLLLATALNQGIGRLRGLFRVGYYLPVVTSIVAIAVIWRYLLEPDVGLLNTLLGKVGIDGPNWLGDPNTTMPSIIALGVWRNVGSAMVIFLAALQTVDPQLYDAARVDGARGRQVFRHITVPMIKPAILFVTVITSIGYLQVFEEPFVMTGRAAARSSRRSRPRWTSTSRASASSTSATRARSPTRCSRRSSCWRSSSSAS